MAIVGPGFVAGSQFLLAYVALTTLTVSSFGTFSFILVLVQFSFAVSNSLFCAPLAVQRADAGPSAMDLFSNANLVYSAACAAGFSLLLARTLDGIELMFATLFCLLANLRWFYRAYAYVALKPRVSLASDLIYASVLILFTLEIVRGTSNSVAFALRSYAFASMAGMAPFLAVGLVGFRFSLKDLLSYSSIWRKYSRASLIGVVTTEATGNAHSYIVTGILGASAFAPLAATGLVVKPVFICSNALTDIERPAVANYLAAGDQHEVRRALNAFRITLLAAWLSVMLGVVFFALLGPYGVPVGYGKEQIIEATIIWLLIAFVRCVSAPYSLLLQAAGSFWALSTATIWASVVSIVAVASIAFTVSPTSSLLGVLAGDCVAAWILLQQARRPTLHSSPLKAVSKG